MSNNSKIAIFLLRVSLGFMFFSAGLSKILGQDWSAAGYLAKAKTLPGLYQWLSSPSNIGWVNLLNEWGLVLIGLGLIAGFLTKWASIFGALMMFLYYLPVLQFPYADKNYLVDQHIIYILLFFLFIAMDAGKIWGLDGLRKK